MPGMPKPVVRSLATSTWATPSPAVWVLTSVAIDAPSDARGSGSGAGCRRGRGLRSRQFGQPVGVARFHDPLAGLVVGFVEALVRRQEPQREFREQPQLAQHLVVTAVDVRAGF